MEDKKGLRENPEQSRSVSLNHLILAAAFVRDNMGELSSSED